ncbi:hypothetical protein [Salimicrobium flavidum]|uniref:hypothetical protein n=1 Tax=Salimicrobium flavidum TaxID=570947 RepID=UPI000970D02B|nr:hypothetical protein [Salimicrobium flavidum]
MATYGYGFWVMKLDMKSGATPIRSSGISTNPDRFTTFTAEIPGERRRKIIYETFHNENLR